LYHIRQQFVASDGKCTIELTCRRQLCPIGFCRCEEFLTAKRVPGKSIGTAIQNKLLLVGAVQVVSCIERAAQVRKDQ
jgi:hypothetical protein